MLMVHSAMAAMTGAGLSGGKTYDEFVAHITALATDGVRDWSLSTAWIAPLAVSTTASTTVTGDMTGSCWGASFRGANTGGTTTTCRMVQHGLPSFAAFNEQNASGRVIFMRVADGTAPAGFTSLNRNGYSSISSGSTAQAKVCTELIYWDGAQAQRMQPSLGLGPASYDW